MTTLSADVEVALERADAIVARGLSLNAAVYSTLAAEVRRLHARVRELEESAADYSTTFKGLTEHIEQMQIDHAKAMDESKLYDDIERLEAELEQARADRERLQRVNDVLETGVGVARVRMAGNDYDSVKAALDLIVREVAALKP